MAEYKGIKGFKVQTVSTDPAASAIEAGTWSSAGSLNTARNGGAGSGTTTAAITAGGYDGTSRIGNVELYNGSTWTETTDINQNRASAGSSTYAPNSATLIFGGDAFPVAPQSANTESWNGSTWTELNDLNTGRYGPGGLGASSSSALAFGGVGPGSPDKVTVTESWNGTSWTEVNDLNTGRYGGGSIGGTSTAGIYAGGFNTVQVNNVESWNGTSWTEIAEINTAKVDLEAAGIQTSGIVFGGETAGSPVVANTEFWNGTSWTEVADLATARRNLSSGVGSSSSALAIGGGTPSVTTATEEWSAPSLFSKENLGQVFYNSTSNAFKVTRSSATAGTWASIAPQNTPRRGSMGAGVVTAGLAIAGYPAPNVNVEQYNGSVWTEVGDINNSRGYGGVSTNSPDTNAMIFGGDNRNPALPGFSSNVETYNGTSWTETTDLPAGVGGNRGAGTSNTSSISMGGASSPVYLTAANSWNGTSWTSIASINSARGNMGSMGTATAALINGGFTTSPANAITKFTEIYDGSTWTEVGDTNSGHQSAGTAGISTLGFTFGGEGPTYPGGAQSITEYWNGTSWTEIADLATARNDSAGIGSNGTNAISSTFLLAEEFNPGTANFTITVS